jgi:dCTP deaminase
MILTDREIQSFLQNDQIIIDPTPPIEAYSSTSVDLTLDEPAEIWNTLNGQPIRPFTQGYSFKKLSHRRQQVKLDNYTLLPQQFILGWTKETITLPHISRIAARVEGKSGLARLGLIVHMTAPTIHAGFIGPIQLEMCNLGPNEIVLDKGMPICQLVMEITYGTPSKGYSGQFLDQSSKT